MLKYFTDIAFHARPIQITRLLVCTYVSFLKKKKQKITTFTGYAWKIICSYSNCKIEILKWKVFENCKDFSIVTVINKLAVQMILMKFFWWLWCCDKFIPLNTEVTYTYYFSWIHFYLISITCNYILRITEVLNKFVRYHYLLIYSIFTPDYLR